MIFSHLLETLWLTLCLNRASASMYSGENKNVNQTIGSMSKICRKQSSERADLVFKHLSHEISYLKIGLEDEGQNGTKEMNEMSIKTPIMMKNFAYHLVQQYKIDASKIITIGLIISGKAKNLSQYLCAVLISFVIGFNISGLLMTHDRGSIPWSKALKDFICQNQWQRLPVSCLPF